MKLQLQVQAKKEEMLYKLFCKIGVLKFSGGNLNIETPHPQSPSQTRHHNQILRLFTPSRHKFGTIHEHAN